jgi:spermidine synthase
MSRGTLGVREDAGGKAGVSRPWEVLDRVETRDGVLELRRRGDRDFLICIAGRVLMTSANSRSEQVLGAEASRALGGRANAEVLVSGLGMGITLRAALDGLPASARVTVAEINPDVVRWCRGALADLTGAALDDPRVRVEIGDVAEMIAAAAEGRRDRFDAIVLDLYCGPERGQRRNEDPFFGRRALQRTHQALAADGVFALWAEATDPTFEKRLGKAGFAFERRRPPGGGLRHAVYLARPKSGQRPGNA